MKYRRYATHGYKACIRKPCRVQKETVSFMISCVLNLNLNPKSVSFFEEITGQADSWKPSWNLHKINNHSKYNLIFARILRRTIIREMKDQRLSSAFVHQKTAFPKKATGQVETVYSCLQHKYIALALQFPP